MESTTSNPFKEWLELHMKECVRDYPDPNENPEYYRVWKQKIIDDKISWEDLREASRRVALRQDAYVNNMGACIFEEVQKIHGARQKQYEANQETFQQASEASKDCPECEGTGWVSRDFDHQFYEDTVFRGALACRCRAGRWIWNEYSDSEYPRYDDLQSHPNLWVEAYKNFSDQPSMPLKVEPWAGGWREIE